MFLWFSFCRADAEDIYIDVYRGRTFEHSSAYSIYSSLRELRTHSVDFILRFISGHLILLSIILTWNFQYIKRGVYVPSCIPMTPIWSVVTQKGASNWGSICAIQLLQVCRPLQKRIHSAIFYIKICITVFSLQNLNGILKQMNWRSAASVSWTNKELKSLQRWD